MVMGERDERKPQPGSLLGQLELGLGVGFLRALGAPADEMSELVLGCVDRDPRWDYQIDDRADYYAQLLLVTGVHSSAGGASGKRA